jgi:hypothetical protein
VDLGEIKDFHQIILEFGECIELVDVVVPGIRVLNLSQVAVFPTPGE